MEEMETKQTQELRMNGKTTTTRTAWAESMQSTTNSAQNTHVASDKDVQLLIHIDHAATERHRKHAVPVEPVEQQTKNDRPPLERTGQIKAKNAQVTTQRAPRHCDGTRGMTEALTERDNPSEATELPKRK